MVDLSIKIFVRAVEMGNFSQVAEEFYMSQPAVSNQIKKLEERFKVRLFERHKKGVTPTQVGRMMYSYSKRMINISNEVKAKICDLTDVYDGRLVIGASSSVGEYLIPKMVGRFKKSFPQVLVQLNITNRNSVIESLLNYNIDLGLIAGTIQNERIITIKFILDELYLLCSSEHPWIKRESIDIEEITSSPIILREAGSQTRDLILKTLGKHKIKYNNLNVFAEFNNFEAIKSAVESNSSVVTIISQWACLKELKLGTLKRVKINNFSIIREINFIRRKREAFGPAAMKFIKYSKLSKNDILCLLNQKGL
jgi:DNA-binding transcriptional LysR family regulator